MRILRFSYRHWLGRELLEPTLDDAQAVVALDQASYAVVSHGTEADPIFNYANRMALRLFEMDWEDFTTLPSRLSAEAMLRTERERLLERVSQYGYIDDYTGIRISSSGKRFRIRDAIVWNLLDETGQPYGQAALLPSWEPL